MAPTLFTFLLLAATLDPLPKEMEYRLSLARALPAPYSAAVIVALMPSAKLSRVQTAALADEAYHLAGKDQATAVLAWRAYRDSYDTKAGAPLSFPQRERTTPVGCDENTVSDPKAYYRNAYEAGTAEYQLALRNVRSAVEVGRAIEALRGLKPAEVNQLILPLIRPLAAATGSDREFVAAVRFTRMHAAIIQFAEDERILNGRQLLANYRTFLTTNLSAMRCSTSRGEEFKGVIDEFNKAASKVRGIIPIPPEAMRVTSVDPATKAEPVRRFPLTYKVEQAPIDETSITSMLHEIEQFQPEEKPDGPSILLSKVSIYQKFAARLKNSIWQDRVIRDWVHFVAYSPLQTENPELWFTCARAFVDWANGSTAKIDELATAGDPGLAAYARLVTLLPESEVTRVLP